MLGKNAAIRVIYPDVEEGIDEEALVEAINTSEAVVCDPLYRNAFRQSKARLIPLPHEGYSGRIFRKDIPVFTGDAFDIEGFLKHS